MNIDFQSIVVALILLAIAVAVAINYLKKNPAAEARLEAALPEGIAARVAGGLAARVTALEGHPALQPGAPATTPPPQVIVVQTPQPTVVAVPVPAAPPAPVVPAPSITGQLFPRTPPAGGVDAPPAATIDRNGTDLGWSNGAWLLAQCNAGDVLNYTLGPVPDGYVGGFEITTAMKADPRGQASCAIDVLDAAGAVVGHADPTISGDSNVRCPSTPGAHYVARLTFAKPGALSIQLNHV